MKQIEAKKIKSVCLYKKYFIHTHKASRFAIYIKQVTEYIAMYILVSEAPWSQRPRAAAFLAPLQGQGWVWVKH
jgi:hypothetical protein